jgi:hypothetical protein
MAIYSATGIGPLFARSIGQCGIDADELSRGFSREELD